MIDADLANNRFTFSRNTLRLNAISVGLDGWVELDGDAVAMDLKAGCDKVQFKDVLSLIRPSTPVSSRTSRRAANCRWNSGPGAKCAARRFRPSN